MESIASTTSSTDGTSQVAAVATIGPRPPLPHRTVPLTARPLARELANQGWNDEPATEVTEQHAEASNDDWSGKPAIPKLPAKRKPSDKPLVPGQRSQYDQHVLRAA